MSTQGRLGAYRAVLLGGGGRCAAEHARDGAGALGGASRAGVARVVPSEEGSDGLKLRTHERTHTYMQTPRTQTQLPNQLLFQCPVLPIPRPPLRRQHLLTHPGQHFSVKSHRIRRKRDLPRNVHLFQKKQRKSVHVTGVLSHCQCERRGWGDEGWVCSANASVRAGRAGNCPAACLILGCPLRCLRAEAGASWLCGGRASSQTPEISCKRLENEEESSRGTTYLRPLRAAACRAVRDARAGSRSAAAAVRAPPWAGKGMSALHNLAR